MNGCTRTDKPSISVLMSLYEPNLDWLRQQLVSIDAQDYPNVSLFIRDDCSPSVPFDEIERCVRESVHNVPCVLKKGEQNLGYNKSFELMTGEAAGDYFAYCDQDDIWLENKLSVMMDELSQHGAELVCSDMYIIDSAGNEIADSVTRVRRHHQFRSGYDLTDTLWHKNFVSGCAMLISAKTARAALPFNPYMYYDHYLALYAANEGLVISLQQPLIRHREHGDNQSGIMLGVEDKSSYLKLRIEVPLDSVRWLLENFPAKPRLKETLQDGLKWLEARQAYQKGDMTSGKTIFALRHFSPYPSLFELAMPFMPKPVFNFIINASRKNIV